MNMIFPQDDFLAKLRAICDQNSSLLIFDEVMTGFRVALGGAQSIYNVKPDLTTLGKVIGGGMPVGAFGGRKEIMQKFLQLDQFTKQGHYLEIYCDDSRYQNFRKISQPGFFDELGAKAQKLVDGLNEAAKAYDFNFHAKCLGGMFGLFFCSDKIAVNTFVDLGKNKP